MFATRFLAAAVACSAAAGASATALVFDDLSAATVPFVADYNGFTFGTNNVQTTAWLHSTAPSIFYVPHSGAGYAVSDAALFSGDIFDQGQPISRAEPFVFDGAWVSGINQVRFDLYNGSTHVYTSLDSPELSRTSSMFVASGYEGLVTSVVISGRQGFFAMDDFTFHTEVPEPSSFGLMVTGLFGLGRLLRNVRSSRLVRSVARCAPELVNQRSP